MSILDSLHVRHRRRKEEVRRLREELKRAQEQLEVAVDALDTIRQECLVKAEHRDHWVRLFCGELTEETLEQIGGE